MRERGEGLPQVRLWPDEEGVIEVTDEEAISMVLSGQMDCGALHRREEKWAEWISLPHAC